MSVLLIGSLAVVACSFAIALVWLVRSGDGRLLLPGALSLALLAQLALLASEAWRAPLGLDATTGIAAAGLVAGLLALLSARAMGRTLRELERAEVLHWETMEGVRGVIEFGARPGAELDAALPMLLEIGCERLGLEVGLVSRVRGERYEVQAIHAPDDYPIARGAVFGLAETRCRETLASDRPLGFERAAAGAARGPSRDAFGFEAYLGTAIRRGSECFGTLVFASREPAARRFTASHKDLVWLIAQWIGFELEREELQRSRRVLGAPAPAAQPAEGFDLNQALQRLERRIRRVAGPDVEVRFALGEGLAPARELRAPLDALVLSLVRRSAEGLRGGGTLELATAQHEPGASDPQVMPAVAPNRYVTLSIREDGGAVDADALTRIFDREDEEKPGDPRDAEAALPLARIYRVLQRAGGDLSMEVEPGRGSTFTIFLPLAAETAQRPQAPARATPPPPPLH